MKDNDRKKHLFKQLKSHDKHYGKQLCLHPHAPTGCKGTIVNAHSVQRANGLELIAKDGHVGTLGTTPHDLDLIEMGIAKTVGIRQASTFTGFCSKHDSETFKSIEQNWFEVSPRTCFLLTYRAFAREFFQKKISTEEVLPRISEFLELLPENEREEKREDIAAYNEGLLNSWGEIKIDKAQFDQILLDQQFQPVRYVAYHLNKIPEILCSIYMTPTYDFQGQLLQDQGDLAVHQECLSCSILPARSGGIIVLGWIERERNVCGRLCHSLDRLTDSDIPHAIIRLVFEHGDNVFFSPSWWENLDGTQRIQIKRRFMAGLPFMGRPRTRYSLQDDLARVVNWNILSKCSSTS